MSESSSDTESSCGWTIINNEGSDIETLGPETAVDGGADVGLHDGSEGTPDPSGLAQVLEQEELSACPAEGAEEVDEEVAEMSLDSTLKVEGFEENLPISEVVGEAAADEQVTLSGSDHSDIVTLEPCAAEQGGEEEASAAPGEQRMGTPSSSQYTFSTAETLFPPLPPPADSSSSETETEAQPSAALRRRRTRRPTATQADAEEPHGELPEPQGPPGPPPRGHVSGTLNKCILLALVVAISMGFGHFYGTVQIQERERQKVVEKLRVNELSEMRGDPRLCQSEQDVATKSKAQKEDMSVHLQQTVEQMKEVESHEKHLTTENRQLKSFLEREEESVSSLQEELRNLRAQIRSLEEQGEAADAVLSENQRLKGHLEDERQRIRSFLNQKETLMAEAQMLRKELDKERRATDRLKEEVEQLSSRKAGAGGIADLETEELQTRLLELEKKLSFEQQRSDLWERLYVETKEERAKGDDQQRAKKGKDSMMGKVKETFDAVKNSTKEFVHHHKEQIKKAKEAVKENLRKFSDSVKSTFRHFKDSATHMFDKVRRPHQRRFHERKDPKAEDFEKQRECSREPKSKNSDDSWPHKPLHRHPRKSTVDTFQVGSNTRKSGNQAAQDSEQKDYSSTSKGCSGVFDCAYQESMSLFNKALDPIRAEEFNQLIHSYLQQEVDHFHHWRELESFINRFFHNGVFIHDQMLFTDFVSGVEDYLEDMDEYQRYDDDVFEDLDDYVYRHFFGDTYSKQYGPSRPLERPVSKSKEDGQTRHRYQHRPLRSHPRPQAERKWSKPARGSERHMPNVKIQLGPMPLDPKY
ncbi:cell cycle progression protein 1 isoform X2 [Brienomyrus brachyistius]|uniref:cell cycle progression protein 1 isoform X2 n=1 Tax=Brienomyrus brachyistius TaxID=42636 RepID=UPI0020B413F5|nr:cell cycle progression protein 1 isoform X2 [Brienomyrus brachyistius]